MQDSPLASTSSPTKASRERRTQASEQARREKLERLVLCRGKLSPEDVETLHEAFFDIFKAHQKLVWDYLRSRNIPKEDAEDLLQETFVLLHQHIVDEGFPDKLTAMLTSMVKWKVATYRRDKGRAPVATEYPTSSSEKPPSVFDIDRALDLRALSNLIMPKLSPTHREVIEVLVFHGLSYRDAAEMLSIPEGTLRSRSMAAKHALYELAEKLLPPSQRGPR